MDVDIQYIALLKWFTMESTANETIKMDQSYLIRLKSSHIWEVRLDGHIVQDDWAVLGTVRQTLPLLTFLIQTQINQMIVGCKCNHNRSFSMPRQN
jgi:hypothetical protein